MAAQISLEDARKWVAQRRSGLTPEQATLLTQWASGQVVMSDNQRKELEQALGTDTAGLHHFTNLFNAVNRTNEAGWGNRALDAQGDINYFGGSSAPGQKDAPGSTAETDPITKNINDFLATLDPNHPDTKKAYALIGQRAQATQGTMNARAGLGSVGSGWANSGVERGGLSQLGQSAIQTNSQTQYDLQRKGLIQQGQGLLNQRDLGLKGLELGYQQLQNQQQEQKWAAEKNQAQGIGAGIGTAVGALGFLGGPALGAATMAGGSALGAGFAGLASGGGGPSYQSKPSWLPSSNRGSLGGTGY